MIDLKVGMKIYDNDWFVKHGLEVEQAADLLHGLGVTYVITQSRFLPMQDTAVPSAVRGDDRARYRELDDIAFREALAVRGIAYLGCLNICFDPSFSNLHPELLPIDQHGRRAVMEDWYVGMPPDREANLQHKIGLLRTAVQELQPEGIHLGFIRWPGFWETWLPDTRRADRPDYCYAPETLRRFREATGVDVPPDDPSAAARHIATHHRERWRDWKCSVTVEAIGRIRSAIHAVKPDVEIAINTLPFSRTDYDDAVTEVFGQDVSRLNAVVDIFEVMAYHQILGRDAVWPEAIATDIKRRSGSKAICTLQAKAMYLDGMHAGRGRATEIAASEFAGAVDRLERSGVDGICIFTFSQFLEERDTPQGLAMAARLKAFRA